MRSPYLALLASLVACGPGSNTDTSTGGSTSSADASTGSPATTEPTGEPTTNPSEPGTASTTSSASTSTTASTGEPGTCTSTSEPGTTSAGSSTGGTVLGQCETDKDCKLQEDCCTCTGVPIDEDPVPCGLDCKQSKCSELGIDAAVCRLGVCETERLQCDQTKVACDSLPPNCPEGQLPTITPACWTGECVPAEYCDVIPDCSFCPQGRLCVKNLDLGPTQPTCEPIPPGCSDDPDCACAGDLVCKDPYNFCSEQQGPVIHCECPVC